MRRITAFGMGILIAAISFSSSLAAATQTGIASVYSDEQTANGEYAHASALTAAHRTLSRSARWSKSLTSKPDGLSSSASTIAARISGVE